MSIVALQIASGLLGTVAVATGLRAVMLGSRIVGGGGVPPGADNDIRYFAAIWAGVGALLLWTIPRIPLQTEILRALGAVVIFGGLVRLATVLRRGGFRGHVPVAIALELIVMPLLLVWQTQIAHPQ